jgi:hypothetical protein
MKVRDSVLCAASVLLLARAAAAQRPGTIEVGGFARYTDFDNSLLYTNKVGIGGRLGVFLPYRFSVEADLSRTSTDQPLGPSVHHKPLHVMLVYNASASSQADIIVGAGYVHNSYSGLTEVTDKGIAGLVGLRYRFPHMLALRLDLNEDFIPSPANKSNNQVFNGNLGMQVGVSLLIGFMK